MPTPSADRLKRLQQMKRKSETFSSAPMLLPENYLKKAKIIQELDQVQTDHVGETQQGKVRYVHEEDHKNFEVTLCELGAPRRRREQEHAGQVQIVPSACHIVYWKLFNRPTRKHIFFVSQKKHCCRIKKKCEILICLWAWF